MRFSNNNYGSIAYLINPFGANGLPESFLEVRYPSERLPLEVYSPGGKREEGENPWQCLVREMSEELGIIIKEEQVFMVQQIFQNQVSTSVFGIILTQKQVQKMQCLEARELITANLQDFDKYPHLGIARSVLREVQDVVRPDLRGIITPKDIPTEVLSAAQENKFEVLQSYLKLTQSLPMSIVGALKMSRY